MKKRKLFRCIGLLIVLFGLFGFIKADDDIIKKITEQLTKWSTDNPIEKVYLHLDKPYYAVGDDIWFKAYVTIGGNHQLSALSGILNVELLNEKDSVKKSIKLPLSAGTAAGDFKLADSLAEGNYRIRAYTNYMCNAGESYFYDKVIAVGNSINNKVFTKVAYNYANQNNQQKVTAAVSFTDIDNKPYSGNEVNYNVELENRTVIKGKAVTNSAGMVDISFINSVPNLLKSGRLTATIKLDPKLSVTKVIPVKAASNKVDVQFFPEGGSMVNGVRNRVAFKAVGSDGLGVDINGTVTDNQDNVLAKITAQHLGMGYFNFTPESGKTYKAKINYPDGSAKVLDLPKADDRGYVLSVYNVDANDVTVKIAASPITFEENKNTEINLIAQGGGQIYFAAKSKLESPVFSAKIARSRFPSGIVQFTLFSAKGEPINERVVFIQNADLLNINLSSAKAVIAAREKVKLNLQAKNKDNQPVVGSFSVAVIDESKINPDETTESTILSNILLTSDIKGYIEKPNYYFTNVSDKTRSDVDILMMTQGYRRFVWAKVMDGSVPPLLFKPEKSIDITGHVKTPGGKPVVKGKVSLFATKGGTFYIDTVTDDQGRFAFRNLVFGDSVKFVVQARTANDRKNVEINLDNLTPKVDVKNKNAPDIEVNLNSSMSYYLQNSKKQYDDFLKYGIITKAHVLQGVTITEKREGLKASENLNGPGNADQVIKADQLSSCATLEQCLNGRLMGVMWRGGIPYSTRSMNNPMSLVVDGIQMDADYLENLVPTDIESIEVLRTVSYTAIYGSRGSGGVLVITTKRGEPGSYSYQRYAPGIVTYSPAGYHTARQFYSPQYDDPKTNSQVADLRTTIFWKPNIITDKDGNASVEFFNADNKGTYRAVVEGIDSDGNLGRQVYRYKVE
jgi:TonB-dependent SusC/RagA subfamily outer membrane receptor